jgi:hypothetical protein
MVMKEGVTLNLISTFDSKTAQGISVQETRKNFAGFWTELISKFEGIVENLRIHLVDVHL